MCVIKDNMFPVPPLFRSSGAIGTSWQEMYKVSTWDTGLKFTNPQVAEEIISISKSFQVDARIIGRVEPFEGKKLTISSDAGTFIY